MSCLFSIFLLLGQAQKVQCEDLSAGCVCVCVPSCGFWWEGRRKETAPLSSLLFSVQGAQGPTVWVRHPAGSSCCLLLRAVQTSKCDGLFETSCMPYLTPHAGFLPDLWLFTWGLLTARQGNELHFMLCMEGMWKRGQSSKVQLCLSTLLLQFCLSC